MGLIAFPGFLIAFIQDCLIGFPRLRTFVDSGNGNTAVSDGIYTVAVPATTDGVYTVRADISGTTPTGFSYRRIASTEFTASAPAAMLTGMSEQLQDTNGNGKPDRLLVTAQLNILEAGTYAVRLELRASNGKTFPVASKATLSTGAQSIAIPVLLKALDAALGSDGPYERNRVSIFSYSRNQSFDFKPTYGLTIPVSRAAIDRGQITLTNSGSILPIDANGVSGYELLRASIGVSTPGWPCSWSGNLTDSTGSMIAKAQNNGTLPSGPTTVALDFSGPRIFRSAKNGPYRVENFYFSCGGAQLQDGAQLSIGPSSASLLAAQFENVPEGIDLVSLQPAVSIDAYAQPVRFRITPVGGYEGSASNISASGTIPGISMENLTTQPQLPVGTEFGFHLTPNGSRKVNGTYYVQASVVQSGTSMLKFARTPVTITGGVTASPAPVLTATQFTTTAPTYNRTTGLFSQQVSIKYTGTTTLTSTALMTSSPNPDFVVVRPSGTTVGVAPYGSAYFELGSIAPGETKTVMIYFVRLGGPSPLNFQYQLLGAGDR